MEENKAAESSSTKSSSEKKVISDKAVQDIEFLKNAKNNIIESKKLEEDLKRLNVEEKKAKKSLSTAKKEVESEIEKSIKAGRTEAYGELEGAVSKLQKELNKLKSERNAAKEKGMNDRIARETEYLQNSNKTKKEDVVSMLKDDGVPSICRNPLYLALFAPKGISDLLVFIVTQLVAFGAIPMLIYYLIKDRQNYHLIIIYVAAVLLFGGGYIFILYITRSKYSKYIKSARDARAQIRANNKKAKQIRNEIMNDEDESGYGLSEIDGNISELQKEFDERYAQLEAAKKKFEEVTSAEIQKEVEDRNAERLTQLEEESVNKSKELRKAEARLEQLDKDYEDIYMMRINKDYLKESRLSQLIALMEDGDAPNIESAVLILKSNGK